MVVQPTRSLGDLISSYRIGQDGPAPVLVVEILSQRSHQQQDLTNKPRIYAYLGVAEYILIDTTGELLANRLMLRRLREGAWHDEQDLDGGITSVLGFRIVLDTDGLPRFIDAATGYRYSRLSEVMSTAGKMPPAAMRTDQVTEQMRQIEEQIRQSRALARQANDEIALARRQAQVASQARRHADERLRQLEAELGRLRRPPESQS
jgi:hypothetical protein